MLTIVIGDYDKEGGGGDCQVSVVEGELSLVIMLLDNLSRLEVGSVK